jgi:hypothetical protein
MIGIDGPIVNLRSIVQSLDRRSPDEVSLSRTSVLSPEMAVTLHRRPLSPQFRAQRSPNGGAFACLVVPSTTEI